VVGGRPVHVFALPSPPEVAAAHDNADLNALPVDVAKLINH